MPDNDDLENLDPADEPEEEAPHDPEHNPVVEPPSADNPTINVHGDAEHGFIVEIHDGTANHVFSPAKAKTPEKALQLARAAYEDNQARAAEEPVPMHPWLKTHESRLRVIEEKLGLA